MNKRDAINEILLSLNELPLDVTDLVEDIGIAIIVDKELEIAKRKVLSQGWYFNRTDKLLVPNVEDYIVIPKTFLSVDGDSSIIVRDWKLYNKTDKTFKFTDSIECSVIEDIQFDDVPFNIANYIVQMASLQSYINVIGNSDDIALRARALNDARVEAIRDNANKRDGNLLTNTRSTGLLDRTSL